MITTILAIWAVTGAITGIWFAAYVVHQYPGTHWTTILWRAVLISTFGPIGLILRTIRAVRAKGWLA